MYYVTHRRTRDCAPTCVDQPSLLNAWRSGPNASGPDQCTSEAIPSLSKRLKNIQILTQLLIDTPKQYQQDLFTELRAEDELVVLARGLGLLHLVTNLLHFYDAAGNNLVLVVGADERENEWIGEGMSIRPRVRLKILNHSWWILALAEHYATSKSPLARGLKVINTEKATVPMR